MLYTEAFNCAKDLLDENPPGPPLEKGEEVIPLALFRKGGEK